MQTLTGLDAGKYTSGNIQPPDLRRVTQYSILGTNITSYKELRSEDQGHTFEPFAQWTRTHTSGNQASAGLDLQALPQGGTTTVAVHPRYDTRGNLRDEGTAHFADGRLGRIFEYDVFSNLTGVYARNPDGTAGLILARFTYDASGHRSSATYNANVLSGADPADSTLANDFTDLYIYDAQWRVRAVLRREAGEIDDPNVRTWVRERWVYHQSGDGEGAFGTGPTGDDAPAARFLDSQGDGEFETVQHFLCNRRGDVVAVVGPGVDGNPNDGESRATIPGALIAKVWYDDYGLPRMYAATDIDHNGVSDEADMAAFVARFQIGQHGQSSDEATRREAQRYRNQLDWDRDGVVGPSDLVVFQHDLEEAQNPPRDVPAELGNLPLYGGYWWDAALELYHVRHRVYDPRLGRWLQRDPLGYAAGSNLYSYVMNQPGRFVDPLGLWLEEYSTPLVNSDSVLDQVVGWGVGLAGGAAEGVADGATMIADHAVGWASSTVHEEAERVRRENAGLWEYAAGDVAGQVGVEAAKMAALGAMGEAAGCASMIGRAAKATLELQAIVDKVDMALAIVDAGEAAWNGDWEQAQDLVVQAAFSYAMSRMMGAAAGAIQCLDGETLVATPNGLVKIKDLMVGDRVSTDIAANGLAATFEETKPEDPAIDPATWRVFVVELSGDEGSDPNATRSGILELLKPVDWYAASIAGTDRIGNAWVWLEIDEWGVKGTAKVLAIKPCPKIKPGTGRLVTMRSVTSYSGMMASVLFKDAAGQADMITGTDGHPVYSIDRCGYVDLGSLEPGERVRTADGWATAESMARWWGREVVHNVEVDGVHRYAVGRVGLLGHNAKAAGGGNACRPTIKTKKSDRVTKELPAGQRRTVKENAEARKFYENNRNAAIDWYERRTGNAWPRGSFAEHPRPLKEGGDPLFVIPGLGSPADPHMIPRPPDGLTDFQRWGREGAERRWGTH